VTVEPTSIPKKKKKKKALENDQEQQYAPVCVFTMRHNLQIELAFCPCAAHTQQVAGEVGLQALADPRLLVWSPLALESSALIQCSKA
jgi:hypothetical protein